MTECRTGMYGRWKKISCSIKDQVRNHIINALSGPEQLAEGAKLSGTQDRGTTCVNQCRLYR